MVERGAVEFAPNIEFDVRIAGLQASDCGKNRLRLFQTPKAYIHLDSAMLGDSIRAGATFNHADIDRDTLCYIRESVEQRDLRGDLADRAASLLKVRARMGRMPHGCYDKARHAFARGDDLAAVARRLHHQGSECVS